MLHASDKQQRASVISLLQVLRFFAGFNICIQCYAFTADILGSLNASLKLQFLQRFCDAGVRVFEHFYWYRNGFELNLEKTCTGEFLKTVKIAPIRRTSAI